jgi:hypothetical protein
MEISEVRKRVRQTLDHARRAAAARRARADAAHLAYETFLSEIAGPLFKQVANILRAEGYLFEVFTPQDGVRLVSARSSEEIIEIELDTSLPVPAVIGRATHTRGSRVVTIERPIKEDASVEQLTEEHLLDFLVSALEPFLER